MKSILLFIVVLTTLTACAIPQAQIQNENSAADTTHIILPNPASAYCEENGNKLEIQTADDGSQSGVCVFPDGSTCEEWAYYRKECGSTEQKTPTLAAPLTYVDSRQDLGQGDGTSAIVGDVDGDGDHDALVSNADKNSTLLLNNGIGIFFQADQEFKPSSGAAFGDLNGDKSLDIFITEETSNEVWLNDGQGVFSAGSQNLISPESSSVALGDLDGDGDLDAFVTNWNGYPDQVFLNDGTGIFTDSGQKLGKWFGVAVSLGDVDKDGDLDALVANNGEESNNAPVIWLNDGTGVFIDSTQRLGFTNAYAAVLGDLDGDGDLDTFISMINTQGI